MVAESYSLILLADGGALADLNLWLETEGEAKKDFTQIPEATIRAFEQKDGITVTCPLEAKVFCNVGSGKAQSFLTTISQAWTVRSFPVTVAKYDKAGDLVATKHRYKLRFHAYLAYALGLIASAGQYQPPLIVGFVTDDPHLLPCMSDARANGIDARLIWWESAVRDEVAYTAARFGVPILFLDSQLQCVRQRDSALQQLLSIDRHLLDS